MYLFEVNVMVEVSATLYRQHCRTEVSNVVDVGKQFNSMSHKEASKYCAYFALHLVVKMIISRRAEVERHDPARGADVVLEAPTRWRCRVCTLQLCYLDIPLTTVGYGTVECECKAGHV